MLSQLSDLGCRMRVIALEADKCAEKFTILSVCMFNFLKVNECYVDVGRQLCTKTMLFSGTKKKEYFRFIKDDRVI